MFLNYEWMDCLTLILLLDRRRWMEVELETFSICGTWYCLLFFLFLHYWCPALVAIKCGYRSIIATITIYKKASSRQCDLQESPVGAVDDENAAMVGNFAGAGVGTGGELDKIYEEQRYWTKLQF